MKLLCNKISLCQMKFTRFRVPVNMLFSLLGIRGDDVGNLIYLKNGFVFYDPF
jgi:hypothetical protein